MEQRRDEVYGETFHYYVYLLKQKLDKKPSISVTIFDDGQGFYSVRYKLLSHALWSTSHSRSFLLSPPFSAKFSGAPAVERSSEAISPPAASPCFPVVSDLSFFDILCRRSSRRKLRTQRIRQKMGALTRTGKTRRAILTPRSLKRCQTRRVIALITGIAILGRNKEAHGPVAVV